MPVGGALGYAFGGKISDLLNWHWAFYLVVPPGLLLAALCLFMRDPRTSSTSELSPVRQRATLNDYRKLLQTPSYLINTAAMTALTFAIGGIAAWVPDYIYSDRGREFPASDNLLGNINLTFGAITAVAGVFVTLLGCWTGGLWLKSFAYVYFLVSGVAVFVDFTATVGMLDLAF